ncbi:MAG: DNA translocase FtsK 4TM domain-containing protein [Sulfurovaceae bacterium]|nr:DNA translocase FtsK 4TM domain-containing protein [Sulfurovaceae bacterium]
MKITMIISAVLLVYGAFSTFFHETSMVGQIGKNIGDTNISLFGYIAYINLLILMYPLFEVYKKQYLLKRIDFFVGWILLFIGLVVFGGLIFSPQNAGFLGYSFVLFLEPYIGMAGIWLFWFMVMILSAILVLDDDFDWENFFDKIIKKNKKVTSYSHRSSNEDDIHKIGFSQKLNGIANGLLKIFSFVKNPFANPDKTVDAFANDDIMSQVHQRTAKTIQPIPKATASHNLNKSAISTSRIEPLAEIQSIGVSTNISNLKKQSLSSNVEIVNELEENSKLLAQIDKGLAPQPKNFKLPRLDFLQKAPKALKKINEEEIDRKIKELLDKLKKFNIEGDVVRTYTGPLVTTFEFKPAPHVKVSKILGLQDDLAMALSAETIRIQAPIPGRDVVGIEIPNDTIDTIYLREILESPLFQESKSPLTVALGKDIVGKPFVTDIKKLPHLLIAGTTGSGKSVGINAMILSLLYRNDPDQLKLMMIDPKMLEFSIYNDIPHLITPVITSPKKAITALANMVGEMERRYILMAENRTKNIENYNEKVTKDRSALPLPYIVVIIDELADLMMNGGKEVEYSIARLAQMARASGIHLIIATQRPSVDVVTGLIKANLPSRLSYRVGTRVDSKVILDGMGAESLLGRGDALFTPPGAVGLVRLHAPWNTEEEIEKIVEFLKAQRSPEYDESYLTADATNGKSGDRIEMDDLDPLYEQAKEVILNDNKTSISYLQRKLQIGYNRAANIIEQMEANGVLSSPNNKGNREII